MIQMSTIIKLISTYRYIALLPLAMLEGPVIALMAGFMVQMGYFSFFPALLILMLGDFAPDSAYYFIGRLGNKEKILKKYDTKNHFIMKHFNYLENIWNNHTFKTIFMSKLAYGLSIPLLITSGIFRLSYKKFIWRALMVTIIQYTILMAIGFYLGKSYQIAVPYIKHVEVIIAVVFVLIILGYLMIQKYIKNKVVLNVK